MNVTVYPSPGEVGDLAGRVAVVIDVIRATTTVCAALDSGARCVRPVVDVAEARALAVGGVLLCGERDARPPPGFDLGNSPSDYTPAAVGGRELVLTTTNGTRALHAARAADRVLTAAFVNLAAVAGALRGATDVAIVCAGREGRFSLDDVLCAGLLVERLGPASLDDGALAARTLARSLPLSVDTLSRTAAGAALVALGLAADLAHVADLDRYALVPELRHGLLVPESVPETGSGR